MALQLSVAVRNALLDSIEATIGTGAILEIRTGSMPANVAASRTGTVLATLTLPSDWMAAASSGQKAKSGTWQDAAADGTGTAGYFTIYEDDGTTPHIQGTCGIGTGDLQMDNTSLATGQQFTITQFTLTAPNA